MVVSWESLAAWTESLLGRVGLSPQEASVVARGLVGANLCGHDSHGVMRLPAYVGFVREGRYRLGVPLLVERETPGSVACDAQWGFGQVQAHRLLELLRPRAEALGVAAGTAKNCGHVGRLGEYAEHAAERGLILVASVNNDGAGTAGCSTGRDASTPGDKSLVHWSPDEG